jgi:hypothetical protein
VAASRQTQLQREVRTECERLYRQRWGRPKDIATDLKAIDYRGMLGNWEGSRPAEKTARALVPALRGKCDAALSFVRSTSPLDGGHQAARLHAAREALETLAALLDPEHLEEADHVPPMRPGIRSWLFECHIEDMFVGANVRDLAVLSLLAGFWPPRMVAGTVERVLTEQDKAVRSALQSRRRFLETPIFRKKKR